MSRSNTESKHSSLFNRSSIISSALRDKQGTKEGDEHYAKVQRLELECVVADNQTISSTETSRSRNEEVNDKRRALEACNKLNVLILDQSADSTASNLAMIDRKDPVGLATRLIPLLTKLPQIGEGLAKVTGQLSADYVRATTKRDTAKAAKAQADLDWEQAVYLLDSALITARAYLVSQGVKVSLKAKPTKKPAAEVVPAPAPAATIVSG